MFRVLVFEEPSTLKLRLEGELDDATVPLFFRAIVDAKAHQGERRLFIDIGDLAVEDETAESAILDESRAGVTFVATSGRIAELLSQQEQRDCSENCGILRRVAYALSLRCQSSSRPLCARIYHLLHSEP